MANVANQSRVKQQELIEEKGKYRILDGVHRWQAHKAVGAKDMTAKVIKLNGRDPLLYAAQKAIGLRQLTEEESRETARRAYQKNPRVSSAEIGKAIGRSRQAVDNNIADIRASIQFDIDLKLFRMSRLGITQERIVKRLGIPQANISRYYPKCQNWQNG